MILENFEGNNIACYDLSDVFELKQIKEISKTVSLHNHNLVKNGYSTYTTHRCFLSDFNLNELNKKILNILESFLEHPMAISNSWINVMGRGAKVHPHIHRNSFYSGAIYPELEDNSTNIIFESNNKTLEVKIKSNHMYLFPSKLLHYTKENESNNRVVLSFNAFKHYNQ